MNLVAGTTEPGLPQPPVTATMGEYVGRYQDKADLTYDQYTSAFNSTVIPNASSYIEPHALIDDGAARWLATYNVDTGRRVFDISSRSDNGILYRPPTWFMESGASPLEMNAEGSPLTTPTVNSALSSITDPTRLLKTYDTFLDDLVEDTMHVIQLSSNAYTDLSYKFKSWSGWTTLVDHWVDNDDGSNWGDWDDEDEVPEWTNGTIWQDISTVETVDGVKRWTHTGSRPWASSTSTC
ncbi:hypothetical protein HK414_16005 [Ramlibacter terrae]|uniref:Uncharacterized protein n=1 Tax=Ramlibacter terrae TaxID=2732511 RepID=A0ABX6P3J6_9BURK|nr:hypothetical protein HK414_16005 [Ramlibacter terrae]